MIFTWIELKKINYDMAIDGSQDQVLINHLATRLPVVKQKDQKYKEAELAFHTGERHFLMVQKQAILYMRSRSNATTNTAQLNTLHHIRQ